MAAYQTPRRIVSTSTATSVNPSAFSSAVNTVGFDSNELLAFSGSNLGATTTHPTQGTTGLDTFDDGQSNGNKVMVDWSGKGCYDSNSSSRRVMFMGAGASGAVADYFYNTMPIYTLSSDTWATTRAYKGANETGTPKSSGHMYDGNAIDVTGRRLYKAKFSTREILVYNLDTNAFLNNIDWGAGGGTVGSGAGDVAMEFIPTRGTSGMLWIRCVKSGDVSCVWEVNPATGVTTEIASGSSVGPGGYDRGVCSYNPRAFSNDGGVFIGNNKVINVSTGIISTYSTGAPATEYAWYANAHLCRDPVGDGWLYWDADGWIYRLTSAGTWSQRLQMPLAWRNTVNSGFSDFVVVPVDEYGVVWLLASKQFNTRAYLYKP